MALMTLLVGSPAAANDESYRDYPMGGRAVGLAGAFTALGSDPSGLFYNPAGLVDVPEGSVQVGSNLYGLQVQGGIADAFGAVVDVERVVTELDIIPSSAGGTNVLERDAHGRPRTVYSLGSFVPSVRSSQTSVISDLGSEGFSGCRRLAYERNLDDRRFLFGAGIGHRIEEDWSAGFSAFLSYRQLSDREEIVCSEDELTSSSFSTADTRVNLSVFAIVLAFGIKHRLLDGWQVGAHLTMPSIRAYGSASVRVRRAYSVPDESQSQFLLRQIDGLRADTRDGMALRFGLARSWTGGDLVSLDISLHAPTHYSLVDIPSDEVAVANAITLTTDVERGFVANVAVGAEHAFNPEWGIAGGLFTNFSSAPSIPGEDGDRFTEDRLSNVHELGATLLLKLDSEHNTTRVGGIMTAGWGSDVVPRYAGLAALGSETEYIKTNANHISIYLSISTTLRFE